MYRFSCRLLCAASSSSSATALTSWRNTQESTLDKLPIHQHLNPQATVKSVKSDNVAESIEDHALLCYLDESRDVLMYGSGKEFHENVKKMRTVIVNHHKWQLSEKWYQGLTWVIQGGIFLTCFFVFDQLETQGLLLTSKDEFERNAKHKIQLLSDNRRATLLECVESVRGTSADVEALEELQFRIRRALLPTSEDYVAIVRKEIKDYVEHKDMA
eukprot:PhF_6_TR15456/c0_g1_i3/m.24028